MANRKLQGEIERVLKKVDEGMQVFESIWDKVYSAPTTAQKEKYEGDLKKEIKKLQRLRDQIKTWQGDSSIKDKTKLDVNRKLIEEKMEKFKVCEKETKTKAFSKEGLAQDRTDPKEKAKREVGEWITDSIFKLREQCDEFEAEVEALSASGGSKRSRKADNPRISDLRTHIERHHFHVKSLERILRAVDNDALPPEKVNELRDGVDYYTDANQEPDFYEDEEMYDQLNLDMLGAATAPPLPLPKTKKEEEAAAAEAVAAAGSGAAASDASAAGGDVKAGTSNGSSDALTRASSASPRAGKGGNPGVVSSPRNSKGGGGRSSSSGPSGRGGMKGSSLKGGSGGAGLSANSPMLTVLPSSVGPPQMSPKSGRGKALGTAISPAQLTPSRSGSAKGTKQSHPAGAGSVLGALPAVSVVGSGHSLSASAPAPASGPLMSAVVRGVSSSSGGGQAPSPSLRSSSGMASSPPSASTASPRTSLQSSARGGAQPPTGKAASDGGTALEELPLSASVSSGPAAAPAGRASYASPTVPRPAEAASHLGLLGAALNFMPESAYGADEEAGGGGGGVPATANGGSGAQGGGPGLASGAMRSARNPAATPACFPSVPATAFNQAALFEKFDLDTLFFIFYYQQGTYQQYLAANELKRQSWRFHKKYLTWFQRHEEPKITTDEFEQGTYVYFDYHLKAESANGSQEYGWCQRVKSEFVFQYEYLE